MRNMYLVLCRLFNIKTVDLENVELPISFIEKYKEIKLPQYVSIMQFLGMRNHLIESEGGSYFILTLFSWCKSAMNSDMDKDRNGIINQVYDYLRCGLESIEIIRPSEVDQCWTELRLKIEPLIELVTDSPWQGIISGLTKRMCLVYPDKYFERQEDEKPKAISESAKFGDIENWDPIIWKGSKSQLIFLFQKLSENGFVDTLSGKQVSHFIRLKDKGPIDPIDWDKHKNVSVKRNIGTLEYIVLDTKENRD